MSSIPGFYLPKTVVFYKNEKIKIENRAHFPNSLTQDQASVRTTFLNGRLVHVLTERTDNVACCVTSTSKLASFIVNLPLAALEVVPRAWALPFYLMTNADCIAKCCYSGESWCWGNAFDKVHTDLHPKIAAATDSVCCSKTTYYAVDTDPKLNLNTFAVLEKLELDFTNPTSIEEYMTDDRSKRYRGHRFTPFIVDIPIDLKNTTRKLSGAFVVKEEEQANAPIELVFTCRKNGESCSSKNETSRVAKAYIDSITVVDTEPAVDSLEQPLLVNDEPS